MINHASAYNILSKLGMLTEDTIVNRCDKFNSIRQKITLNLEKAHKKACKRHFLQRRTRGISKKSSAK